MYPCDEKEQDRLDIMFQMMSIALDGKLHLAPLKPNPQRILELATGTGLWAITMGRSSMKSKRPTMPSDPQLNSSWQETNTHRRRCAGLFAPLPALVASNINPQDTRQQDKGLIMRGR